MFAACREIQLFGKLVVAFLVFCMLRGADSECLRSKSIFSVLAVEEM